MNFNLNTGQWIVIGLSAFLFIWYVYATSTNRKRGIATYRWLHAGLSELGKISEAEWIGSSNMGARMAIKKADKPFRSVEAHYLLEPREFLPYWLFSLLRGKRDEVLVRFTLRKVLQGRLEINRITSRRAKRDPGINLIHPEFKIVQKDFSNTGLVKNLETFLKEYGQSLHKISVQREVPHLEIYARIKPLLLTSAEAYFQVIQTWFEDA